MNRLNPLMGRLKGWAVAAALAFAVALPCTSAFALDRVTLKAGNKVVEGTIIREEGGNIFFKYMENGVEKRVRFAPDEILKVERNVDAAPAPAAPATPAPATPAPAPAPAAPAAGTPAATAPAAPVAAPDAAAAAAGAAGAAATAPAHKTPKAMVITLGDKDNGDMVGVYFTAHALREIIPGLEKELGTDRSGIVVFRIYSGGGLASEVPKIHKLIREEYMKRWRVVAWVESSISAAAMTPHCMEEIYFTSQANYGACTMFSGRLVMSKGFSLAQVLDMMEKVSRQAGYDPLIMRSMQIPVPVSATVYPDGSVKFFEDETSGEFIVNRKNEILTLTSTTAAKIKFSKGTADTLDELTKLMGYKELDWVGNTVPGIPWPVSKEEKAQMDFRKKTKSDEDRSNDYIRRYQTAVSVASQIQNRDDRAKAVGKARQALDDIRRMVRNNPAFILMALNMGDEKEFNAWVEEQEKLLRDMMR